MRWLIALKPLVGVVWFALLVLPWFLAILCRAGDSLLRRVGRRRHARQGRSARRSATARRPAIYFAAVLADLLAGRDARGAGGAGGVGGAARAPVQVPAGLAGAVAGSCSSSSITKLPHYVLPLYPAIAILIAGVVDAPAVVARADWLERGRSGGSRLSVLRSGSRAIVAPIMIAPAVRAAGLADHRRRRLSWAFSLGASTRPTAPSNRCCARWRAALLIAIAIFSLILPSLRPAVPEREPRARPARQRLRATGRGSAGYHEPSLVFLAGTVDAAHRRGRGRRFLRGGDCRFAFVEARQERSFAQRAEAIGLALHARGRASTASIYSTGSRGHDRGLSLGKPAMSVTGGLKPGGGARHARGRDGAAPTCRNGSASDSARPARGAAAAAWPWRAPLRLALGAAVVTGLVAGTMRCARCLGGQRGAAPAAVAHTCFDEFTDFGKSSWFLIPTGVALLAFAALASPALPRHVPRLVLAALSVRIGFVFLAVGLPGLVVAIVKRLIGRARPLVGGERRPIPLSAVRLERRICEPAVRARHHRIRSRGRARRAVAAAASAAVDLRGRHRGEPGRADGAPSRAMCSPAPSSAWSARCWFATGSRRAGSASCSSADGRFARCRGRRSPASKGLPGSLSPHKKLAPFDQTVGPTA